jgi:hypothetical protein
MNMNVETTATTKKSLFMLMMTIKQQNHFVLCLKHNFHISHNNFEKKNSNAQNGRVNTFHILQPIHKGPSNFKLCMKGPLRFPNFKI